VSRQTEQATCVLMASMLCAKSLFKSSMLRACGGSGASYLCAQSHSRVKSRLCLRQSQLRVKSKQVVCRVPAKVQEQVKCAQTAGCWSRAGHLRAESQEQASCLQRAS
jgi:hypothetical protein